MSKVSNIVAGVAVLPVLAFAGPVSAAQVQTGQIEGGNIYRVANLSKTANPETKDFYDPAMATCGETVLFRVRIHNIGAYELKGAKVKATMPTANATSHSSLVTVSATNGNTVTDTAGVSLDKSAKLSYVNGSTELLDANQSKESNLPDGILAGGVTLGDENVGVSTQQKKSVQFQAKVTCETTPPVTPPVTPPTTTTTTTPTELVKTGAGDVAAMVAAAAAAGAVAYRWFLRRQNAQ